MDREYKVGDLVWAKLKGYPWWPARIENESSLTKKVASKKPKNPKPVWPVFFFGSKDYGWFGKECLRPFKEGLSEYGTTNKKGNLFATAMRQAQNPELLDDINIKKDLTEIKAFSKPVPKDASLSIKSRKEDNVGTTPNKKKRPLNQAASPDEPRLKKNNLGGASYDGSVAGENLETGQLTDLGTFSGQSRDFFSTERGTRRKDDSPTLSAVSQEEVGLEGLKNLRQELQKATLKEGYDDLERVENLLSKLEDTPVTAVLIRESKVGKLMRHLLANAIPENDYEFKSRFKKLASEYKRSTTEAQEAGKASPQNGEARAEPSQPTINPPETSNLPEVPQLIPLNNSHKDAEVQEPKSKEEDEKTLPPSSSDDKDKQDGTLATIQSIPHDEVNDISDSHPVKEPSPEDKNGSNSPKESDIPISSSTEVSVINPTAVSCTD